MAKLIFAMNQSLDGYVAAADGALDPLPPPGEALFRHFVEFERGLACVLYGRRIYEVMRYWDEDRPDWTADEREFAAAWRAHPKWVVSRSAPPLGPNAALAELDLEAFVRGLKSETAGVIAVAGPQLAGSLTNMRLIDEYHLYFRPVALGAGTPYFAQDPGQLRLLGADLIGEDTVRLRYEPAG
ncbi:MAG TPA: dihydrofolate reductase family protein [Candidatus Baltobacteraceae bacterium]|nr:dihydrofolate reductase family protein [Candidatus Baltobacteraceae bacterium]